MEEQKQDGEDLTKRGTLCAEVRGLTTVIVTGADYKPRPWASRYLSDNNGNNDDKLEGDKECRFLRWAAQILPRRNEEVVALGLLRPSKPEHDQGTSYVVYTRNSVQ